MFGHLSYFRLISNNNFVPLTKTKDEVDWNSIGENDSFTTEYNEDKITQAFTQQDLIHNFILVDHSCRSFSPVSVAWSG